MRVPAAHADGDPASDVLVTQTLFDPYDAGVPASVAARLEAMLGASARNGFPIRVALINSGADLGTVAPLWSRPLPSRAGSYAHYLGAELSDLYHGQVLVVMPGGYGLYGPSTGPHALRSAEATVSAPTPRQGSQLGHAALVAVSELARAAGHPIDLADLRVDAAGARSPGTPLTVWIALLAGLLVIAAAWTLSLRARPLRGTGATPT